MSALGSLKEACTLLAAVAGAVTIGYGVVVKAGWVISRAEAASMITVAVQEAATTAAQAVADEAKARQLADLRFQIGIASQRVTELLGKPNRSEAENYEIERLKNQIEAMESQVRESE